MTGVFFFLKFESTQDLGYCTIHQERIHILKFFSFVDLQDKKSEWAVWSKAAIHYGFVIKALFWLKKKRIKKDSICEDYPTLLLFWGL